MSKVIHLTKDNFKAEVLESKIPVLVDFWATWCGPCRIITPIIEEISENYAGKIKVGKINTEEESALSGEYGVISIPTLIFFRDGKPVDQVIGAVAKNAIAKKLDAILS
jgi:thioredoxin 1